MRPRSGPRILGATLGAILCWFGAERLDAEEVKPAADKSGFSLFNPTPRELMREMTTDRPDRTESPFTVDAGHFQLEMDAFNHVRDHDEASGADTHLTTWTMANLNLKVGLLNWVDFQLMIESYTTVKLEDRVAGTVEHHGGFGDVVARVKFNLWGNDGGRTAFGVMPYVKIPSNQDSLGNKAVEGGVILPLAIELPHGFGLGLMSEFDFNEDALAEGRHTEFVHSVTLSHDLVGKLGGYVEFWSLVSDEADSPWMGTVDLGISYEFSPTFRVDAGVNIGVTRSADDFAPFLGVSFRY